MGHQLVMTLESRKMEDIITKCPRVNKPDSLNFLFTDQTKTRLYKDFSDKMIEALETLPITFNVHNFGLRKSDFFKNENLVSNYTLLSTNIDDNGVEYVSSTEHKKYPFYTVQFHPEKNLYKFHLPIIPHSNDALEMANLMAEKLVKEAKLNSNSFDSYQEMVSAMAEGSGFDKVHVDGLDETYYFKFAYP